MKLLVITQTVDTQDTTLGFFHRWIEEFSRRAQKVTVICLRKGNVDVPQNTQVFSLGKEYLESNSRIFKKLKYTISFYTYIWKLRDEYDLVFIHMNQEYVVLGGFFWKLCGKKIFFWRNHPYGNLFTRIAVGFSDHVFCTSIDSFTARFKKTHIMPAGVDTKIFDKNVEVRRIKNSLLVFGRIAPIKRIEVAIDLVSLLKSRGIEVSLSIIGDALPKHSGYLETLKDRVEVVGVGDKVSFQKGVPFSETPLCFARHEIFVNFTPTGSFDKTVIEALACGTKTLVSNGSMKDIVPTYSFTTGESEDICKKIEKLLSLDEKESIEYSEQAETLVQKQSLNTLMDKLFTYMI